MERRVPAGRVPSWAVLREAPGRTDPTEATVEAGISTRWVEGPDPEAACTFVQGPHGVRSVLRHETHAAQGHILAAAA